MSTRFPRIYLAIDNCFASKRWTAPGEWARKVREIGLEYVEASADTECDALYTTPAYRKGWIDDVRRAVDQTGVRVANLYSGHGTYGTLGLAHTDVRLRDHMQHAWLGVMAGLAACLGAGLGFFCHAFAESVLQAPGAYAAAKKDLYTRLAQVAALAADLDVRYLGVEQMYTPHQIPWTRQGARELVCEVYAKGEHPFYITIDVGHACGQTRFQRLERAELARAVAEGRLRGRPEELWLGPASAYRLFDDAIANGHTDPSMWGERIESEMSHYPHLFADPEDGDPYAWLEDLGSYSPIIHVQQTPGDSSPHLPFTSRWNAQGIIRGEEVLRAIGRSYERPARPELPPPCEEVYLTIEVFPAVTDLPVDIVTRLQESVRYWRQFVPDDGLRLDELIRRLPDHPPA